MIEGPVVVKPVVYELPLNLGHWCKLGELCEIAKNVVSLGDADFEVTISELITRFAGLVRQASVKATLA